MAAPLEGRAWSNEAIAQRFRSVPKRTNPRHAGPSAWNRYEPSTSAVMLPEGWSLASSTEDWDKYSHDAATTYNESLRRYGAAPAASDQSSVHASDASIRSASTTQPSFSIPAFVTSRSKASSSSTPPSTISSWKGRGFRRAPRPPSSIADSLFSEKTASEASTGITLPSPVSSSTDLGHRFKGLNNARVRRTNSNRLAAQSNEAHTDEGSFDITIPAQPLADLDNVTYRSGGWTHEADPEQTDDNGSLWAAESIEGPFSEGHRGPRFVPRSSSLGGHGGNTIWAERSHHQDRAVDVTIPQGGMPRIRQSQSAHGHLSGSNAGFDLASRPSVDRRGAAANDMNGQSPATRAPVPGLIFGLRRKFRAARSSIDQSRPSLDTNGNTAGSSRISFSRGRISSDQRKPTDYSLEGLVGRDHVGNTKSARARQADFQDQALEQALSLQKDDSKEKAAKKSPTRASRSAMQPSESAQSFKEALIDRGETLFDRLRRRQRQAKRPVTPSGDNEGSKVQDSKSEGQMDEQQEPVTSLQPPSSLLLSSLSPPRVRRSTSHVNLTLTPTDDASSASQSASTPLAVSTAPERHSEQLAPQRPLRLEPMTATERRASVQVSRHDVQSSVEHKFNAAHDKRWSQSGGHYMPLEGKNDAQDVEQSGLEAATSEPPTEQGTELAASSDQGSLQARLRKPFTTWFASKRKMSNSVAEQPTKLPASIIRNDQAAVEAPRRFSMSVMNRPRAASALGHSTASPLSPQQIEGGILRSGSLRFLPTRPGSHSVIGLRSSRWGGRGQSIDLSTISRPRFVSNTEKPLPPLPSALEEVKTIETLPQGEERYSFRPSDFLPSHRNSISEAPVQPYSIVAETSDLDASGGQAGIAGIQRTQDEPVAQALPHLHALRSRPTRSFSDLFTYDQVLDNQQRLRQWTRPASVGHAQLSVPPISFSSSPRRPKFGLDLQPDAAAAFDSIPLPDSTDRRRSSVRPEEVAASLHAPEQPTREVDAPSEFDVPGDVSDASHSDSQSDGSILDRDDLLQPLNIPEEAEDEFSDALDGSSDSAGEDITPTKHQSESSRLGDMEMLADDVAPRPSDLTDEDAFESGNVLEHIREAGSTTSLVTATEFGSAMTHMLESPRMDGDVALRQP